MIAPKPRGPASEAVLGLAYRSADDSRAADGVAGAVAAALAATQDVLADGDVQLALTCLYEQHYLGIAGIDERWEWHPGLLAARTSIESAFEQRLRAAVHVPDPPPVEAGAMARGLATMTSEPGGPGLAAYVARRATVDQLRELLIQRSVFQLKEADPHTWAIPRLSGRPKAALVEIQADEYGGGSLVRMHSQLFARTMREAGLDDTPGAYVSVVATPVLTWLNVMSLFGLHRRLRGAAVGHLAAFEMTSSVPNRLYSMGFRRHGFDAVATEYFDEHVEADAVHEQIAARDLAGGLAEAEPDLAGDVLFGAAACLMLDELVGEHLVGCWKRGQSSLFVPAPGPAAVSA
jgi:hypothetical protein